MARLPIVGSDDGTWGTVLNDFLETSHNADGTLKGVQTVINVKEYGALGDGVTNDTAAIQSAIDAGPIVFFPSGLYKVTRLEMKTGTTLLGVHSGGYGTSVDDTIQSRIGLIAGTNDHLIHIASGVAHVRIRDLHFDGNKNNNSSGDIIHIEDASPAEEAQLRAERIFVDAAAGYGIYVGNGRRAVKIQDSTINYCGVTGIRLNGSDNLVRNCIVGSNVVDGIGVGAAVSRVLECDIYGNTNNGINVYSTITKVMIANNGLDTNGTNGILLSASTDQITIANNTFHSNSQTTNNNAHHINVVTTTGGVSIMGNIFSYDSGKTNAPGYGIYLASSTVTVKAEGNILDESAATNSGLANDYTRLATRADSMRLWMPTGAQFANMDRRYAPLGDVTGLLSSGRLQLAGGIVIPAGVKLTTTNKINVLAGNTAGATLTHIWFCLVDQSGNVLVKTSDDTSGSWGGNSVKSLNLSSTYFASKDIAVYIGIVVVGTTMPSFRALNSSTVPLGSAASSGTLPMVAGSTSDTGLTDPASLGSTIGTITAAAQIPYGWIS